MTTGYSEARNAIPPGGWPPPDVRAEASRLQLGDYLMGRRPSQMSTRLWIELAVAGGFLFLMVAMAAINESTGGALDGIGPPVVQGACVGMVAGSAAAIRELIKLNKQASFYLYRGGIASRAGNRVQALTWPEVRELRPIWGTSRRNRGQLEGFVLARRQGESMVVPTVGSRGSDPFVDQLMALLQERNVPVRKL